MPSLKSLNLYQNRPKIKLFLQKINFSVLPVIFLLFPVATAVYTALFFVCL